MRNKLRLILGLAALTVVAAACAPNASQDSLDPQGPYARQIDNLFNPVFFIATGVFIVVEGLILLFCIRYRHRKGSDRIPQQIHGNTKLEIGWTILPTLVLVAVAVPTVTTVFDLARKPEGDVLNIRVVGHQWWWEYQYTDPDMQVAEGQPLKTANEMVIPEDRPVYITLECEFADQAGVGNAVIHSFSVPELAGTQDCVPGQTGHINLQADNPGTYEGTCREFCGYSHADMRFRVKALTVEGFEIWTQEQKQDAATSSGSLAAKGADLFANGEFPGGRCIQCHSIQGLQTSDGAPVAGNGGPNLTHFASRDCFAGCIFDTDDPEQIAAWLRNPPGVKWGSKMLDYGLTEDEIDALVAYLQTLE